MRKYDKAPARKIGVINHDSAVTGSTVREKTALDVKEANNNLESLMCQMVDLLDQINKNLKLINEIDFEETL